MAGNRRPWVTAIVLAAGKGSRLRAARPKPLLEIAGKPVLLYSLQVFERCSLVRDIIVVVNPQNENRIRSVLKKSRVGKIRAIVLGGRRRQDSVAKGLATLDAKCTIVLIHDAARPFITPLTISRLVRAVRSTGAAIVGVPVKSTIKKVARRTSPVTRSAAVEKTIDRNQLWEAQTPQAFRKDIILPAYRRFGKFNVTDDAGLAEKCGQAVVIVKGSYANIKVTTSEDVLFAETIARARKKFTE